jgi:vancomycin permeability regulator SanA
MPLAISHSHTAIYSKAKAVGRRHGRWLRSHRWRCLIVVMIVAVIAAAPVFYTVLSTRRLRFTDLSQVPDRQVAIVFGAGVQPDGMPTPYLQSRLNTAIHLYDMGKTSMLLLSGDNSTSHYNEPVAMQRYVVAHGVPKDRTVLDYAGFNTYDTCYRAAAIFSVKQAILVSHGYHLPRAITTCRRLGVQSVGVAAEGAGQVGHDFSVNYLLREVLSTDKSMPQIIFKPRPTVLGAAEPIDMNHTGQ